MKQEEIIKKLKVSESVTHVHVSWGSNWELIPEIEH